MSVTIRRRLAGLTCRVLLCVLPPSLEAWGWAVCCETTEIKDDTKALMFALEGLFGLIPQAIISRWSTATTIQDGVVRHPRIVGIACAICSVFLGLAYLALADAPARYLSVNLGALVFGLMASTVTSCVVFRSRHWADAAMVATAIALLATALLGEHVDGASRWVRLSGLFIQPSLISLPVMIVAYAQLRSQVATASMIVAAFALAVQPDRAMAGMLAAGLGVLATMRADRLVVMAFGASIAGFAATLFRANALPAAPYVDQIFYSAFDVHLLAGMAVLAGSLLLLVPAAVGWRNDTANRNIYATFGTSWSVAIIAAAIGNYPTPIVGYGGSAIIGYALCVTILPRLAQDHPSARSRSHCRITARAVEPYLRVELA